MRGMSNETYLYKVISVFLQLNIVDFNKMYFMALAKFRIKEEFLYLSINRRYQFLIKYLETHPLQFSVERAQSRITRPPPRFDRGAHQLDHRLQKPICSQCSKSRENGATHGGVWQGTRSKYIECPRQKTMPAFYVTTTHRPGGRHGLTLSKRVSETYYNHAQARHSRLGHPTAETDQQHQQDIQLHPRTIRLQGKTKLRQDYFRG